MHRRAGIFRRIPCSGDTMTSISYSMASVADCANGIIGRVCAFGAISSGYSLFLAFSQSVTTSETLLTRLEMR